MTLSLHMLFHQEVGEEINIHRGQHERRIFTSPAGLFLDFIQRWPKQTAKLLLDIVKDLEKMLITELNHVAENDEKRFGVVIHQILYGGAKILKTALG